MFWIRNTIIPFFFCCFYLSVFSQPFQCDGSLILSTVQNNTTNYKVIFGPFGAVYYTPISVYLEEQFDAMGFNPKDNFIYAVHANTNSIVRLKADGSYETLSAANQVITYAGDCSPDGFYYCHDHDSNQILIFDVVDEFQLVNQLDLFWSPFSQNTGSFTTRLDDFVIDPFNPNIAYAFHGRSNDAAYDPENNQGFLVSINLDVTSGDVGMVTPIASIPQSIILKLESLFFTASGQLFGYGPYTIGSNPAKRLISINQFTGEAEVQGITSPESVISDGCSCPYNISFTNFPTPNFVTCSDSELTYSFTINNGSNELLSNLVLTDTIPEGMIINEISDDFNGTIVPGTGVGTRIIAINNLTVNPRAQLTIDVKVGIIDIPTGLTANKAHLYNLPSLFGGYMGSDDPQTLGYVGDSTTFYSDPRNIEDVELTIIPPSNCLDPNDAQVFISSPQFLPNQTYQIKLINQDWEEFLFTVLIDNDNSFMLDNMTIGEYQLAEVTPVNSRCSFKWRDESILIEPPNEQLQVTAATNSPVCEGAPIQLSGTISPSGTVIWEGPQGWVGTDINTVIDSAAAEQNGIFEMIATYGACEQIRELDMLVSPYIEAAIIGKSEYCERENMLLEAAGVGDELTYNWSGPANLINDQQSIDISSMSPENEGVYQVIIDNGYCLDTSTTNISLLPSPTISLPKNIETDFCQTVKLEPEISGDNNVEYAWIPNLGLDCYDCPTPELQVPFKSRYRLTVMNDYMCADTAAVRIALSNEKLIYIPNIFSPNFDGFNDVFQMFPGCGVSNLKNLQIFDRWGSIIYSKIDFDYSDAQEFWDGRIGGKVATSDVYLWQVEMELVDGSTRLLFGNVGLVR